MRITQAAKAKTEKNIVQTAERLFTEVGYKDTTTRQIALEAGIATGTLFNYFPTKETLAMSLLAGVLKSGRDDYLRRRTGEEDFAEELFLLITSELRRLRPFRTFVGPVLESTMSLFPKENPCPAADNSRAEHLGLVRKIIHSHGFSRVPDHITTTLYWSLYLGILAFWSNDDSRNQEETLALIDYSIKVFTGTLADTSL
jgi:AcrR family transcriptional regulator